LLRRHWQAILVESSKFKGDEAEFLWAPYSVFKVQGVDRSYPNTEQRPHIVTIEAAADNRLESEDLPLAPWY